ncbi:hypothetical protein [Vibrio breoganii]|uniref:hypothetical protein n=1 Tax=Vibrio breoganii TaxID=553239 RepID=UPI0021C3CCE7|nr:hypothetical protein [Vibrio breoganii]MDN3717777.1 hypothetical protein [Vibrio breoganii]
MTDKLALKDLAKIKSYSMLPNLEATRFIDKEIYEEACFKLFGAVELAYRNTFGPHLFGKEASFIETWGYEDNYREMLEATPIYKTLIEMYQYGQLGNLAFQNAINDEKIIDMIPMLHMTDLMYEELVSRESPSYLVLTVLHKYLARLKLDLAIDLSDEWSATSDFFPLCHHKHFNLYEMALLANVKSVNSIRNSVYAKEDKLTTIQEDGKHLVERDVALAWLAKRKHFVKSFSVEHETGPIERMEGDPAVERIQPSLTYVTRSGKNQGQIQVPHIHGNGKYVVSKTRFAEDYIYVDTLKEVLAYLQRGYKVRMSGKDIKTPASLVALSSIKIK